MNAKIYARPSNWFSAPAQASRALDLKPSLQTDHFMSYRRVGPGSLTKLLVPPPASAYSRTRTETQESTGVREERIRGKMLTFGAGEAPAISILICGSPVSTG